ENSKEAILAFNGEVFQKLKAKTFSKAEFEFAQKNLFILSGLYGILRPLDLIEPYRLEMGTNLPVKNFENLYKFWNNKITDSINKKLEERNKNIIINLASHEYFKAVNEKRLKAEIIAPVFKEFKNGEYKTIFIYVKQARGMMCNFIIKNRIENPEELKFFDKDGYHFDANLSTYKKWVFTR
ncbi:MAG: peroxide stress protein YaaA, partial [Bacteroidales bacterium]|nr:peroxide stress protein YaaA [Bacteroidales bacterium]